MARFVPLLTLLAGLSGSGAALAGEAGPAHDPPGPVTAGGGADTLAGLRTPEREVLRVLPRERGLKTWECQAECQERRVKRRELRIRVA